MFPLYKFFQEDIVEGHVLRVSLLFLNQKDDNITKHFQE